ncbi:MAG: hypothetical protein L6R40_004467 [Gallowayella cf. fulva]|nr:MAG: hypothetical protein L6R40_004467 [Xanthomendoza cf. fulva]
MSHSRGLLLKLPRSTTARQAFSTTRPAFVNVGDRIPDIDLVEASPGNKVNLAKELKGKGLVIGVPAAFSTFLVNCSPPTSINSNIPAYTCRLPPFPILASRLHTRILILYLLLSLIPLSHIHLPALPKGISVPI